MTEGRRLLKSKEASKYLSISQWKLRSLVQTGKLPVIRSDENGPFLLDVGDLDRWVDQNKRIGVV